jgi:hypothetical protein
VADLQGPGFIPRAGEASTTNRARSDREWSIVRIWTGAHRECGKQPPPLAPIIFPAVLKHILNLLLVPLPPGFGGGSGLPVS